MRDEPGVRFGLTTGALVLTMLLVAVLPLGLGASAAVSLIAAAALSTVLPLGYAVGLGAQAWAYFTGFFIHQDGQLTVGAHDLRNLAGFVLGTVLLAHIWRGPSAVPQPGGQE
jgi:hypothetical protein